MGKSRERRSPAPEARFPALLVTVDLGPFWMHVSIPIDRTTGAALGLDAVAGPEGSELDAIARQASSLATAALKNGATLAELLDAMPPAGSTPGLAARLIPAMLEASGDLHDCFEEMLVNVGMPGKPA